MIISVFPTKGNVRLADSFFKRMDDLSFPGEEYTDRNLSMQLAFLAPCNCRCTKRRTIVIALRFLVHQNVFILLLPLLLLLYAMSDLLL